MNFLQYHVERIIMEFGNNLDFIFKRIERDVVTIGKINNLDNRIRRIENHLNLNGDSVSNISNIKVVETVVSSQVNEIVDDVTEKNLVVKLGENSRRVLLKSPETINDDSWVHVSDIV